jgi:hypothetical protein
VVEGCAERNQTTFSKLRSIRKNTSHGAEPVVEIADSIYSFLSAVGSFGSFQYRYTNCRLLVSGASCDDCVARFPSHRLTVPANEDNSLVA